jgi:hypothetical protein
MIGEPIWSLQPKPIYLIYSQFKFFWIFFEVLKFEFLIYIFKKQSGSLESELHLEFRYLQSRPLDEVKAKC